MRIASLCFPQPRSFWNCWTRADDAVASDPILDLTLTLPHNLGFTLSHRDVNVHSHSLDVNIDLALAHTLDRARDHVFTLDNPYKFDLARERILTLAFDIDGARANALNHTRTLKLAIDLKHLKSTLPSLEGTAHLQQWWQVESQLWIEQLQQVIIQHRNIGHDWQFAAVQERQLQRYYNANKFLVELMKIEGALTDDVRAEIEDSLLLPWEELQRRDPETYGNS